MTHSVRKVHQGNVKRLILPAVLLLSAAALLAPTGVTAGERTASLTAIQEARVELGRRLFFEPEASSSRQRSCASCHALHCIKPKRNGSMNLIRARKGATVSTGMTVMSAYGPKSVCGSWA